MAESVMRQGLKSWLKVECQSVGSDLIGAVVSMSGAVDDAFELSVPGKTIPASEMLEVDLKHAGDAIEHVPLQYLTGEERAELLVMKSIISDNINKLKHPANSVGDIADTIQKQVLELNALTQKYLLEKVVECQCGKPGEIGKFLQAYEITDSGDTVFSVGDTVPSEVFNAENVRVITLGKLPAIGKPVRM